MKNQTFYDAGADLGSETVMRRGIEQNCRSAQYQRPSEGCDLVPATLLVTLGSPIVNMCERYLFVDAIFDGLFETSRVRLRNLQRLP